MRVLMVTPEQPSQRHLNGGATRQFQLARRLVELGHEVTVIAPFLAPMSESTSDLEAAGMRVVGHERSQSRLREIASAVIREPSLIVAPFRLSTNEHVSNVFWTQIRGLVQTELDQGGYDLVAIEHAVNWIGNIDTDLPVALTMHEVESPQYFAKAERIGGVKGFARKVNGRRIRASERRWVPKYDAVITMSEEESELLRTVVPDAPPTYAVGNGALPKAFQLPDVTPDGQRVLFTGTMAYTPNRISADWLAREVWPIVLKSNPDATLEIVGRGVSAETIALGDLEGVSVIADAPDIIPHLSAADVCAIPMLEGGGTRLKLADAMAAARGIVATTNGATGVNLTDGRELLIADSVEDFADAILALLRDRERRTGIGRAARKRASELLNWDTLGEDLALDYMAIAAVHARTSAVAAVPSSA
ncbi:MAG: glycosyltransferase [Thermoleophilaceae bacterium]|nr:glycosyltransferase [Thermoleophilaceae bacterium]